MKRRILAVISALVMVIAMFSAMNTASAAHKHEWSDWYCLDEPSCESPGLEQRYCLKDDSHIQTRTIPAPGHDWKAVKTIRKATCTRTGQVREKCTRCGETRTRDIPMADHTWGDWHDAEGEPGTKERVCKVCGKKDFRYTPSLEITLDETSSPANGRFYAQGEIITFTATARNIGSGDAEQCHILIDSEDYDIGTLGHRQTVTRTFTYTVTREDAEIGVVSKQAALTCSAYTPRLSNTVKVTAGITDTPAGTPAPESGALLLELLSFGPDPGRDGWYCGEVRVTNTGSCPLKLTDLELNKDADGEALSYRHDSYIITVYPEQSRVIAFSVMATDPENDRCLISREIFMTGQPVMPDGTKAAEADNVYSNSVIAGYSLSAGPGIDLGLFEDENLGPVNGKYYVPGEQISYNVSVFSCCEETATNLHVEVVFAPGPGGWTDDIPELEGLRSKGYEWLNYTVTEADAATGYVENTVTLTADGLAEPVEISMRFECGSDAVQNAPDGYSHSLYAETSWAPATWPQTAGETVNVVYSITNTGDIYASVTGFSATNGGGFPCAADTYYQSENRILLAPGDTCTITVSYHITQEDINCGVLIRNICFHGVIYIFRDSGAPVTAENRYDGGLFETAAQFDSNTVELAVSMRDRPDLELDARVTSHPANGLAYVLGETIEYSITVTNNSAVPATNVRVTDHVTPVTTESWTEIIPVLAPGESYRNTSFSHTVVEQDLKDITPWVCCGITVTADDHPDHLYQNLASMCHREDAPFSVKKKVLNAPANGQFFVPGEIIRYEVDVTNTSSLTYNFIAIMDFAISPVNVADSTDPFAPGESMTCELEYTVTELDAFNGYAGNEAWACNEYGQKEVSNTVLSPCGWNKYDIEVIKDIISRPANEYYYTEGETVIFRIQVINRSTCPVSNVELYDMLIDNQLKAFAAGPFAPGETAIDICLPYTVTAFDVMMGHGGNVALAQIGDQPGGYYSNYVEFGCGEYAAPELTVTKEVVSRPGGGRSYYIEGEDVTYVITYTDTGNTDLYDVVVYDGLKQADLGVISTDILLHPGESRSVTYVYTVANYDVERGYLDNTARAEYGFFECETVVSNTVRVDTDGIPDPDIAPAVTGTKGSGGTASARSASGPEKPGDTVIPGVPGTSAIPGMTGGEDCCHADYSGGAAVLTFCPQHMETESTAAALNDPAAVRALWKQALNDEYAAWLSRCNGPAQAVLLTERAQFSAFLAVREQTLKLLYPDDQAAVDSIIAGMMREKVAVMCCELHTAPAPRTGLSAGVTGTGLTGRIDEMNAVCSSMSRYSGSDLTIFTVWLNARGDLLRVIWPGDESMAQAALEQDVLVNIRLLKELQ